jgi:hypothetical protein
LKLKAQIMFRVTIDDVLCKNRGSKKDPDLTGKQRALLSVDFLTEHLEKLRKIHDLYGKKTIFIIDATSDRNLFTISRTPEYFECKLRYDNLDNLESKYKENFKNNKDGDFGVITFSGKLVQSMTFDAKICFQEMAKKREKALEA